MKITRTETKKDIIDRIERHLKDAKEVSYSTEADIKEIPGGVERNGVMCEAFETTGTIYINLVIKKEKKDEQEPEPDHRKQLEIENEERVNQLRMENEELRYYVKDLKAQIDDMDTETRRKVYKAVHEAHASNIYFLSFFLIATYLILLLIPLFK